MTIHVRGNVRNYTTRHCRAGCSVPAFWTHSYCVDLLQDNFVLTMSSCNLAVLIGNICCNVFWEMAYFSHQFSLYQKHKSRTDIHYSDVKWPPWRLESTVNRVFEQKSPYHHIDWKGGKKQTKQWTMWAFDDWPTKPPQTKYFRLSTDFLLQLWKAALKYRHIYWRSETNGQCQIRGYVRNTTQMSPL